MPTSGWRNAARPCAEPWCGSRMQSIPRPASRRRTTRILTRACAAARSSASAFLRWKRMRTGPGPAVSTTPMTARPTKAGWYRVAKPKLKCRAAPARCAALKSGPELNNQSNRTSEQKIPLRHRQHLGRRAGEEFAIGGHLVGFRIDGDVGGCTIVHHALFGNVAGVLDRDELLLNAELVAQSALERGL